MKWAGDGGKKRKDGAIGGRGEGIQRGIERKTELIADIFEVYQSTFYLTRLSFDLYFD
jgi:hypothetical protein